MSTTKTLMAGMGGSLILAASSLVGGPAALAANGNGSNNEHNRITICHATGSQTNPFVIITPNANGVINGHVSHQDQRDVIPSFDFNDHGNTNHFNGQNTANLDNCQPSGG